MTLHLTAIEAHAEGEPGRVLVDVDHLVPGNSIAERFAYAEQHLHWLRRLLLHEPRGYPGLCAVLTLTPSDPSADVAIIVMEQGAFTPMSGSNTMCSVTGLLETGRIPMVEPVTTVTLETAVGLVQVQAECSDGKVTSVTIENVPAFAVHVDVPLEIPVDPRTEPGTQWGQTRVVPVDVAFGGQFFVLARAEDLGVGLSPADVPALQSVGARLKLAVNRQYPVSHPLNPGINTTNLVMITGPGDDRGADGNNAMVMATDRLSDDPATWTGALDRSPCGTGTCARMSVMHARGEIALDQPFVHRGMLDTTFTGRLVGETTVGDFAAVLPTITGRGWVTGRSEWVLDDSDPFPEGYTIGDIWPA
ncbi:MAG: proline racemase family protein [Candidatus Nanopelagicales bacterium]